MTSDCSKPKTTATPLPSAQRLSEPDALALLRDAETPALMERAHAVRLALHGRRVHMVHSLNINPTNICENRCELCAFWRDRKDPDAYVLDLNTVRARLRKARDLGLTDLHVVGGLIPELSLDYYVNLLQSAKAIIPSVLIQGPTAVEIHYLAKRENKPVTTVLETLKAAGLDAISGGGAEVFEPRVRERICPCKISADEWLETHEAGHGLGIPTNATMLFGHYETIQSWVDHLGRLRKLQDRTGGFRAFVLLPFHPAGTRLDVAHGPSGHTIVRLAAVSRLFLDNVPHLRVLANYMERKLLEVLTFSGVDDIGGTSLEERIARAAGAPDSRAFRNTEEMKQVIVRLGLDPVLVNSAYVVIDPRPPVSEASSRQTAGHLDSVEMAELQMKAAGRERLTADEALCLYTQVPFQALGRIALACRRRDVPGTRVTYVIDRNLSITNVCESGCRFCAFHVAPGADSAFAMSEDEIATAAKQAEAAGATQLMIQGGLNPDLDLCFYEAVLRRLKRETGLWLHSLSPTEIVYLAERAGLSMPETLQRLVGAGLDSVPGGGAEILVDAVRQRVSPHKIGADQWFEVMRTAHRLGLRTTATMVYGLGESAEQRIEHFMRVRALQDETGCITAFIPWSFQPRHTRMSRCPEQTGVDYLRMVAIARIVLDNIAHIQAGWVTESPDLAQLALSFGADDFGGVLMEEQVVRSTGLDYSVTADEVVRLIRDAGFVPTQRTTQYAVIRHQPETSHSS